MLASTNTTTARPAASPPARTETNKISKVMTAKVIL